MPIESDVESLPLKLFCDDGISSMKCLFDKPKTVSCVRLPSDEGIGPLKLQSNIPKYLKNFRFPIDFGNSPEKCVLETSKYLKGLVQFTIGKDPVSS